MMDGEILRGNDAQRNRIAHGNACMMVNPPSLASDQACTASVRPPGCGAVIAQISATRWCRPVGLSRLADSPVVSPAKPLPYTE